VLVLIVIAAIVVVVAVVFVALGRGGGMSAERNDYFPIDLGPVSATDVALLRPPTGLWGYNMQVTDEAMEMIAESIRERDVRIVALEQLVTDLSRDHAPMPLLGSPYVGARHRRAPTATAEQAPAATVEAEAASAPRDVSATETARHAADETAWLPFAPPPTETAESAESARLPYEPPLPYEPSRPSGDVSSVPPEESHD
jgi:hypothetical protein